MAPISDDELLANLKKYFKHADFRSKLQKDAIRKIISG